MLLHSNNHSQRSYLLKLRRQGKLRRCRSHHYIYTKHLNKGR